MQCAFCGTDNRPEHKFCGMCGVKLERRQAERRVRENGLSTKCASCGESNSPGVKFCVMCGTRIERRLQERRGSGVEPRAAAIANAQLPTPEGTERRRTDPVTKAVATPDLPPAGPRREPAIFRNEPPNTGSVSGPSFLGLNTQSEGDGEYLLEDEPTGSGLRKFILLIIIAAILGLVFVQWRSSFKASPKPAPQKTEPAASPAPQGENQAPTAGSPASANPSSANPSSVNSDQSSKDAAKANDSGTVKDVKSEAENPIVATSASDSPNASDAAAEREDQKPPEADAGKPDPKAEAKPEEPTLPDHKPSASLLRARQYLQGRGVRQNCEQGLLYLKAAAEKNDPGAAIQMAALYSSGHCVKQDRVMAYRWFNSAHELEPANMWIQKNMDQLWAQMTSQERRLAGY